MPSFYVQWAAVLDSLHGEVLQRIASKMTKRVRRARNGRVEIKCAAIDENERDGGENGFRKAPLVNCDPEY